MSGVKGLSVYYPFPLSLSFPLNVSVSVWGRGLYLGSWLCKLECYYYGHVEQSHGPRLKPFIDAVSD